MKNLGFAAFCAWAAFVLAILIGWVLNVVDVFLSAAGEITALFVLRVVGIFIPIIGAYLGWFA